MSINKDPLSYNYQTVEGAGYAPAPAQFPQPVPSRSLTSTQHKSKQEIAESDRLIKVSITLAAVSFIVGAWPSLICIIPAIVLSSRACESEADGNLLEAQRKRKIVRILNIVGIVFLLEVVVGYVSIRLFVYFLVLM